ncbi:MAG TPA: DNA-processing protein DprA [Cellulomonadaceae bacterium]|nr:DNA-processing protein DprA [Cellulomonadaceae bacterium]
MRAPLFDLDDDELARAAWSRLAEPGDMNAGALIAALGPSRALHWLRAAHGDAQTVRQAIDALGERVPLLRAGQRALSAAVARWGLRLTDLDPRREIQVLRSLGGALVTPGTACWPAGLDDLGAATPPCLWVRGDPGLSDAVSRSVALVGARASTAYGNHVAGELAAGLAARQVSVVSGGAYGIDAAAHRGALLAGGTTVVLLAGGVDRAYPAGNAELLRTVVEHGGSVLSEVPPGGAPSRWRFLQRNRLIAGISRGTVVVEAAWRSGALSTANRAGELMRPVGAVPGPVTSMASAGCHRLLRDGAAVCVTDVDEVVELIGEIGRDLVPSRGSEDGPADGLGPEVRRVHDALPVRTGAAPHLLAREVGLSEAEVRGALGTLELLGIAARHGSGWRKASDRAPRHEDSDG